MDSQNEIIKKSDSIEVLSKFLTLVQSSELTDDLVNKVLSERLESEQNKFKIGAVALILRRLQRAQRLIELTENIEDEVLTVDRIVNMKDGELVGLYKQVSLNIEQLLKMLMTFEENFKPLIQNNTINNITQNNVVEERDNLEINTAEALRQLSEIIKDANKRK